MWSYEAVRLIERLPHYWRVVPDTDPIRVLSAVYAHLEDVRSEENEHQVMDADSFAQL